MIWPRRRRRLVVMTDDSRNTAASGQLNRAQFLQRAAALSVLATAGSALPAQAFSAAASAAPAQGSPHRGLAFRRVAYDTGTGFLGADSRVRWRRDLMRGEIRAIADRLHANWVSIYGSNVKRLTETATEALRRGLKVSIQPRAFDQPQPDALEQLRQTAREAERLRRSFEPEVILVIGCEFMLVTPGIVPGKDFYERMAYLMKGEFDFAELQRKLGVYVAKAVAVARRNFHGPITYGAASDLERIDWSQFDIVGLDYYSYHQDPAEHSKELAPFRKWNKPILILEFGCCTFTGAPGVGGMGWDIGRLRTGPAGDQGRLHPRRARTGRPLDEHAAGVRSRRHARGVAVRLHLAGITAYARSPVRPGHRLVQPLQGDP
jgi:hypothetical protein